jgi:hypothetical protein
MPLPRDLLPVTDCSSMNCFAEETGAAEVPGIVACSPNADDRKKTIAKRVSVENSEECFILIVDFLAMR